MRGYEGTLRAAASSEGLRIWRSWQTAVRKRTASAMTPFSPSAKAYTEWKQADCKPCYTCTAVKTSHVTMPCMSTVLETTDSLTRPLQFDKAPSTCKQPSLHLKQSCQCQCRQRSGSSKPVQGRVGGKPVGPHCRHRSPSHRYGGRRQPAAASLYRSEK